MSVITVFLIALVVLAVVFVKMAVVIIPQSETKIVERLGKYYATLGPGINIIIPFMDRPKTIVTMYRGRYAYSTTIDLREQVYDFDKQNVITKDNIQMQINALLYFQIVDPFKAVYEINNLPNAIEKLTQTTLRNIIGEMELDHALSSRDMIKTRLKAGVADEALDWGLTVKSVEIQDIKPSESMQRAMELQASAERERKAMVTKAEGEKQAMILTAEARLESAKRDAEAQIMLADASSQAITKVTAAFGENELPMLYLLGEKYIASLGKMAESPNAKTVLLPGDLQNTLRGLFQKLQK